ncbi:hypothetical protein [Hymenobacter gummosus]|uniref:hypothetical protein n=1 Tax=Hymenobacter gummosus TaxID=1776032 RepID=UPI001A9EFAAA|nr:hypothetical protein [Hymenobacter gummosus]
MRALRYLRRAHQELARQPSPPGRVGFGPGARWMHQQLGRLRPPGALPPFDARLPYERYGWLKYGLCGLSAALVAAPLLAAGRWGGLPLAGLAFYLVEIHLLFVFPLLLDQHPRPLRQSARLLHRRIGVGPALLTVLLIAAHMLLGLLRPRRPLLHWYAGCLAVLYWYEDVRQTCPGAECGTGPPNALQRSAPAVVKNYGWSVTIPDKHCQEFRAAGKNS